jgi:hypothetical protein
MAVVPTGPISTPQYQLRELLATLTTLQTWLGVGDADGAKAKIYEVELGDPEPTHPFLLINTERGMRLTRETQPVAGTSQLHPHGSIALAFFSALVGTGKIDQQRNFTNAVGGILQQLMDDAQASVIGLTPPITLSDAQFTHFDSEPRTPAIRIVASSPFRFGGSR